MSQDWKARKDLNLNNRGENSMNELSDKIWNYLHLNKMLVRSLDKRWNLFYPSLILLYKKLERLFEEYGGL